MPFPRPRPGQVITGAYLNNINVARSNIAGTTALNSTTVTGDITHSGGDVGFFGTTPASQQAALTAQHATLTQAGSDTGDVAVQAAVDSALASSFGFANAAEFEAVVACVRNLMVRVQELEDKLQAYGLLA